MMDPNAPPPAAPLSPLPPVRKRGMSAGVLLALGCGGFLALGILGMVVVAAVSGGGASVADNAVLRMKVAGELPEYVRREGLEALFGKEQVTVHQHLVNLQKAAKDPRIKGVLLELGPLSAGFAKVEELRDALVEFKKSGKFVVAYADFLSEKEYALALGADEIVMPKDSFFEFNGLSTDVGHYPGVLEKLGIEMQYFRYGKYKSVSGQQMGLKAFTEPVKEMINDNLALVFTHFVDAVATARKLDPAQVRAFIDEGHLKADWAQEHRLIDTLAYFDELEASLKKRLGTQEKDELKYISASRYREVTPSQAGLVEGKDTIALIYSVGLIVSGKGGDGEQGSEPLIRALKRAVEDHDVKAILFRVDSPGGAGLGCDYVRREIEKAQQKKPVIVSMSDVAASGGYWVSMDATAIVAQPTTATGSIGIFSVIPSLGGLYEKIGLNNETFKVGVHADAIVGARKLTDDEAKAFDADLFASYRRFVELAAKGRKKSFDDMQEVAQGRTWYGSQALERGLVDQLGGFPVALALAKEKAGIAASTPVRVELFDKKESLFETWLKRDEQEEGPELADLVLKHLLRDSLLAPVVRKHPGMLAFSRAVLAGERTFALMETQVDYR
jgi:protease-4